MAQADALIQIFLTTTFPPYPTNRCRRRRWRWWWVLTTWQRGQGGGAPKDVLPTNHVPAL